VKRLTSEPIPLDPAVDGSAPESPAPASRIRRGNEGSRLFEHEGRRWIARVAGTGALGTGHLGLALVEAIHFCDAGAPDRPLREALVALGRFDALYDVELAQLCSGATAIPPQKER
jgi:hypothetical protein